MTVNDLREKLKDLPDDMPVGVEVGDEIRGITGDVSLQVEKLYCWTHKDELSPDWDNYDEKVPYWAKANGPKAPVLVIRG